MPQVRIFKRAAKERDGLPEPVRAVFGLVEHAISRNPYAPGVARAREKGWGSRTVLVAHARHHRTAYRMAWEVLDADHVMVLAYGPHEGFYERLARRAKQH